MTLLIVFLTVTNIAVGYGLAIYLGHARPLWNTVAGTDLARSAAKSKEATRLASSQEPVLDDAVPDPIDRGTPETDPSDETGAQVDEEFVAEDPAIEMNTDLTEERAAQGEAELKEPAAEPETSEQHEAASQEIVEQGVEEEVLSTVEAIREDIHEKPEPPPPGESLASEEAEEESDDASNEGAEETEQPKVSEEDLLQGIGAFQEQLKKQQELSKIQVSSPETDA